MRAREAPSAPRRLHVLHLAGGKGLGAHHAAGDYPFLVGQRQDDIFQPRPHHRHQTDGEDQVRKGEQDVHQARDYRIHDAAQVAGGEPRQNADRCRQKDDGQSDEDGDSCAIDQARQNVAAQRVAAQEIGDLPLLLPDRRLQAAQQVRLVRVLGRDQRCQQGHQGDQHHQHRRDHGQAVGEELVEGGGKAGPDFRSYRGRDVGGVHSRTLGLRTVYRRSARKFRST